MQFMQKKKGLRIVGKNVVNTMLLDVDKDEFLQDFANGTPQ